MSTAHTVVEVRDLRKRYRLGVIGGATLGDELKVLLARLRGRPNPLVPLDGGMDAQREGEHFWALRGVSFDVQEGEILGIIGKNGAGKSTLLKLLSRITTPTEGTARMKGRVSSLLEVGTGFNPELTGRENIYLNGAVLGMDRSEIDRKLDEIIAFSGIKHHIDTPTKRYSSGMKVRLGFAVAAHLEPEIMIIDEVLAVGDAEFQRKCLGKMKDVAGSGRTVLFVSHNMVSVKSLCDRVIWLKDGKVHMDGPTEEVVRTYLGSYTTMRSRVIWDEEAPGVPELKLREVRLDGLPADGVITTSDAFQVHVRFENLGFGEGEVVPAIHLLNGDDVVVMGSSVRDSLEPTTRFMVGTHEVCCTIPGDLLNVGEYRILVQFAHQGKVVLREAGTVAFEVHSTKRQGAWFGQRVGVVRPKLEWAVLE